MLATARPVPGGPGWEFEVKFDGVRAIGHAGCDGLRLYSRNDRDISRSYPEVAGLELGKGVIVDGVFVALDEHGRPDFSLLQHRMYNTTFTPDLIERVPLQYSCSTCCSVRIDRCSSCPTADAATPLGGLDLGRPRLRVPAMTAHVSAASRPTGGIDTGPPGATSRRLRVRCVERQSPLDWGPGDSQPTGRSKVSATAGSCLGRVRDRTGRS
jgi:bifunctional non-homologous end joining protein LigD